MNPYQPLLLFNNGSVLHILNPITREFVGSLAGHGGVRSFPCLHPQPERTVTEHLTAYNIYCRPPEATALVLHDGEGFHDANIRSDATGETAPSQSNVATSEIRNEGRVGGTRM